MLHLIKQIHRFSLTQSVIGALLTTDTPNRAAQAFTGVDCMTSFSIAVQCNLIKQSLMILDSRTESINFILFKC